MMLSEDECLVEIYGEDIGVYFEELELDFVVNHLHPIVVVQVELVLDVEEDQGKEDKK